MKVEQKVGQKLQSSVEKYNLHFQDTIQISTSTEQQAESNDSERRQR